ncbi:MAG: LL-diaminopimelate aminotransferase [Deltaproteobacteria bacterium]|nr:LL-diaminopimelate aminotransferase [Deltaproteobacteria bacterium]
MQSQRLNKLPPYLFAELDRKKKALLAKGADLIDLSIGDPDIETPPHIVKALRESVGDKRFHRYPPYNGIPEFREAAVQYMKRRFNASLDVNSEILTLIGSKEGIYHTPFALANPGDAILVPSPGYPVYSTAAILAGCAVHEMPLKWENNFLPDFSLIPKDIIKRAKILFLNYPNNPTSAVATKDFFAGAVEFARQNNILLCHDAAYVEIAYDGLKAPSIFEVEGAKEVAVEFHSLSKTFNMTGWRIGFVAGKAEAVSAIGKIKTNADSSATAFVQRAAAAALASDMKCVEENCRIYKERREILAKGLKKIGLKVYDSSATFYVWASASPLPSPSRGEGEGEGDITSRLLEKSHIAATPGEGFGTYGKGYIRFSLSAPTERIKEAVERIS